MFESLYEKKKTMHTNQQTSSYYFEIFNLPKIIIHKFNTQFYQKVPSQLSVKSYKQFLGHNLLAQQIGLQDFGEEKIDKPLNIYL